MMPLAEVIQPGVPRTATEHLLGQAQWHAEQGMSTGRHQSTESEGWVNGQSVHQQHLNNVRAVKLNGVPGSSAEE